MSSDKLKPADACDSNTCLFAKPPPPAVSPYDVKETADGTGVMAFYRCPRCGNEWFTGWGYSLMTGPDPWSY